MRQGLWSGSVSGWSHVREELPGKELASWVGPVGVSVWHGQSHQSSGWREAKIMPHDGMGIQPEALRSANSPYEPGMER